MIIFFVLIIIYPSLTQTNNDTCLSNLQEIKESKNLAEKWLVNNLNDYGYFNYYYNTTSARYLTSNNMIRQLMASRLLAEMAQTNESLHEMHQKNLDYVFEHWYRENGSIGYIYFDSKSKLGAMAMALRTLIYSPFYENYTEQAEKLYNCIKYLQNNDGGLRAWYIEPSYSYDEDYLLTFYSGEATLSLVEYYLKTNNQSVLDTLLKSQDYYVEKYVENLSDNYYPAYVPWHTQALNKLYKITKEQKYADAIFILNDELLEIQDTTNNETLGRFFNYSLRQYGKPHSSSDGVYTEGLAYAYEIAYLLNDEQHIQKYKDAIEIGANNLISLQYTKDNTQGFSYPERSIGALKLNASSSDISSFNIRIDTTQHTLDGYTKIVELFDKK